MNSSTLPAQTPVQRQFAADPERFCARLKAASCDLYGKGYRLEASAHFGIFFVFTPSGKRLRVDVYGDLCTCAFFTAHHLPCGCKHLRGLESLLLAQFAVLQEECNWQAACALVRQWRLVQEKRTKEQPLKERRETA